MERAHVYIRLHNNANISTTVDINPIQDVGIKRITNSCVRLEHCNLSPGTASISFERVYDEEDEDSYIYYEGFSTGICDVVHGKCMSIIATGAPASGKSKTFHGDKILQQEGFISLAIRQVFSELSAKLNGTNDSQMSRYQVLLTAAYATDKELRNTYGMCHPYLEKPVEVSSPEQDLLLQHAIPVHTAEHAMEVYRNALQYPPDAANIGAFILALFVETKYNDDSIRRGRLMCIDMHRNTVLDPNQSQIEARTAYTLGSYPRNDVFNSTISQQINFESHFSMHHALSRTLSNVIGGSNSTYFLIYVNKHLNCQRETIQALLYASKAKDIKCTPTIQLTANFTVSQVPFSNSHTSLECETQNVVVPVHAPYKFLEEEAKVFEVGSINSLFLSNITSSEMFDKTAINQKQLQSSSSFNLDSENHGHHVYHTIKQLHNQNVINTSPSKGNPLEEERSTSTSTTTGADSENSYSERLEAEEIIFRLYSKLSKNQLDDEIPSDSKEFLSMTFVEQVKVIEDLVDKLDQSLIQASAIKEKCVSRISELSQTMVFQAIETEKKVKQLEEENTKYQYELQQYEDKFSQAIVSVETLQNEVAKMKKERIDMIDDHNSMTLKCKENNHANLLCLSSRLETAMDDAKGIVSLLQTEKMKNENLSRTILTQTMEVEKLKRELEAQSNEMEHRRIKDIERTKQEVEDQFHVQESERIAKIIKLSAAKEAAAFAKYKKEVDHLKQKVIQIRRKATGKYDLINAKLKKSEESRKMLLYKSVEQIETLEKKSQATEDESRQIKINEIKLKNAIEHLKTKDAASSIKIQELEDVNQKLIDEATYLTERVKFLEQIQQEVQHQGISYINAFQFANNSKNIGRKNVGRRATVDCLKVQVENVAMENDYNIESDSTHSNSGLQKANGSSLLLSSMNPISPTKKVTDSKKHSILRRNIQLAKKEIEELTTALAVANQQETLAKQEIELISAIQQKSQQERDKLLEELNRLRQDNWSLTLALQVSDRKHRSTL